MTQTMHPVHKAHVKNSPTMWFKGKEHTIVSEFGHDGDMYVVHYDGSSPQLAVSKKSIFTEKEEA